MIKLDKVQLEGFIEGIDMGMSVRDAAAAAGFNKKTFYDWKLKAARDPEEYPDEVAIVAAYTKAKGDRVKRNLKRLDAMAGEGNFPALKLALALDGYNEKLEVAVEARATVRVDLSKLPREMLDALCDGEGDDLDIPEDLLGEVMAAQGEQ